MMHFFSTFALGMQQTAQAVQQTAQQIAAGTDMDSGMGSIAMSSMIIMLIQKSLKTNPGLPGQLYGAVVRSFPGADKWAHRAINLVLSIGATAGVHWTWTGSVVGSFVDGGALTIHLPALTVIGHNMADAFFTYVTAHTMYLFSGQSAYVAPQNGPQVLSPSGLANLNKGDHA